MEQRILRRSGFSAHITRGMPVWQKSQPAGEDFVRLPQVCLADLWPNGAITSCTGREFGSGGHFAAMETPDLLVGDVRAFFSRLR